MRVFRNVIFVIFGFLAQVGSAQNSIDWERETEAFERNVEVWRSHNTHSYSFVLDKGCDMCGWYFPAKVVVKNSEVVAVLDPETDEPMLSKVRGEEGELVLSKWRSHFLTIDQIFVVIENALENNATTTHAGMKTSDLIVEYDDFFGFPVSLYVGSHSGISRDGSIVVGSDGGLSFGIIEFVNAL